MKTILIAFGLYYFMYGIKELEEYFFDTNYSFPIIIILCAWGFLYGLADAINKRL